MNNPNPFVPKGSLLEQQSLRRSRLKIAVGCVLAVSILGLVAMLIQGCKREAPDAGTATTMDTNPPPLDLSNSPAVDTNMPPAMAQAQAPSSNSLPALPPVPPAPVPQPQPMTPPPTEAAAGGSEYVVVQGDTLAKIAKAHGVSLKALEAANPGVEPKKLKIKQKLTIPAATSSADAGASATPTAGATGGSASGESYTVKTGDTLGKIAKRHGMSLKALKAANNLTTDHIKVGDKLSIPAKGDTGAAAATATAPTPDTTPVMPPMTSPAPIPAPGAPAGAAH
jgi:LysM repeat protein